MFVCPAAQRARPGRGAAAASAPGARSTAQLPRPAHGAGGTGCKIGSAFTDIKGIPQQPAGMEAGADESGGAAPFPGDCRGRWHPAAAAAPGAERCRRAPGAPALRCSGAACCCCSPSFPGWKGASPQAKQCQGTHGARLALFRALCRWKLPVQGAGKLQLRCSRAVCSLWCRG